MNPRCAVTLSLTALLMITSSADVFADKIAKKLASAKLSLQEAVTIAEQSAGGKAYKAKLEKDSFGLEFEIDLLVNGREVEVSVDAETGDILKVRTEKD